MLVVTVVVAVTGARPNLDVQNACAAGSGDTRDATAPIAPVHVAAETRAKATCMRLPRRNSFAGAIVAVWVRIWLSWVESMLSCYEGSLS